MLHCWNNDEKDRVFRFVLHIWIRNGHQFILVLNCPYLIFVIQMDHPMHKCTCAARCECHHKSKIALITVLTWFLPSVGVEPFLNFQPAATALVHFKFKFNPFAELHLQIILNTRYPRFVWICVSRFGNSNFCVNCHPFIVFVTVMLLINATTWRLLFCLWRRIQLYLRFLYGVIVP